MNNNEKAIEILKLYKQRLEESVSTELGNDIKAFEMAIEALGQTRWIPVSERLPEEFQRVLVTIVNYKGNQVVRVAEYYNCKGKGVFQIKENHEQWEVGEKGLLAWMLLPEPYKEKVYETKFITHGNCMLCGKELTEGLFLCKECGEKANKKSEEEENGKNGKNINSNL